MDYNGWYDLDSKDFKYLQDIVFVGAMLPPTGGRNNVTLRCLRHFHLLYATQFETESLNRIFSCFINYFVESLSISYQKIV